MLPDENMWTSEEFQQYLKNRGCGNVWQDSIYPGMKKAVIAALQCTQDVVEMRKVGITTNRRQYVRILDLAGFLCQHFFRWLTLSILMC